MEARSSRGWETKGSAARAAQSAARAAIPFVSHPRLLRASLLLPLCGQLLQHGVCVQVCILDQFITTSAASAAVSSGVTLVGRVSANDELVDSLELHGSTSRHAASSTTLLAGTAPGIAFALGLTPFAALPLTFATLACPVRSTTIGPALVSAWRLGVGFNRGFVAATLAVCFCQSGVSGCASPGPTVACFLVGGGWSGGDGLRFTDCL